MAGIGGRLPVVETAVSAAHIVRFGIFELDLRAVPLLRQGRGAGL